MNKNYCRLKWEWDTCLKIICKMPVRLRITLLFALIVFVILSFAGGSVYYFSYINRIKNITTRLTNRAITTARFLSQSEVFDRGLIQKIESSTNMAMSEKSVQAYDKQNERIYLYSDKAGDTLQVNNDILDRARAKGSVYFIAGKKDVIACNYKNNNSQLVIVMGAVDGDGRLRLQQLKLILWLSFIGGLIVTMAGGFVFSKSLLLPIKKIADDVNEISARSLTRRIHAGKTNDEWNYLSATLNSLLNRLQESFEMQQHFIAHASHELSTPLTSISSQLEVSLQRNREAGDYRRVMESIYQDTRHLNKLTQTLLEFASTSGNTTGITIEAIRIDEILLRLPGELVKTDDSYSVMLLFQDLPRDDQQLLIWGNDELLFSAINNVVSNACKYSPDHKAVVKLASTGQAIKVMIQDNGPGIPASELKNIFQPFYRIDDTKHIKGFGLGLSLANRIIKLHKGQISIESTEGAGTSVTIEFPVAHTTNQVIKF